MPRETQNITGEFTPSSAICQGQFVEHVIPILAQWRKEGRSSALVTLINIDGSSPRPLGSQMIVSLDGQSVGHITSGCAEAAIISEAQSLINQKQNKTIRYGVNSPYFDVQLPCGSGIDVYFDTLISDEAVYILSNALNTRQPCEMFINLLSNKTEIQQHKHTKNITNLTDNFFIKHYQPPLRLIAAGKGINLVSLARLASELGWEVIAVSPEEDTLKTLKPFCLNTYIINTPNDFPKAFVDKWTACVLLFHEHEWEPPILKQLCPGPAFYIGALGSRKTHSQRVEALLQFNLADADINRIHAPIGLDIGGLTPPEIALSALAEIVQHYRLKISGI